MIKMMKTAITIPKGDYQKIELLRKRTGKSRSQILVEAFHAWLKHVQEEELEGKYAEAYCKRPENIQEIENLVKASLNVLDEEKW